MLKKEKCISFNILVNQYVDTWKCLPNYFRMLINGHACHIRLTYGFPHLFMKDLNKSPEHGWDLIITNQDEVDLIDPRKLVMPRYRKSYQAYMMNNVAEAHPELYSDYNQLVTYDINNADDCGYRNMPLLPEGRWVLKSNVGARGVAMLFFNVERKSNSTLTTALKKLDDAFTAANGGIPKLEDPNCQFIVGDYRGEEEIANIWRSERGWCLQQVVPDVKQEYRIIKGIDEIEFILERPTHKVGGQQVVSAESDKLVFSRHSGGAITPEKIFDGNIIKFIIDALPNCSSIDLYRTESGKWGIFEFSNQFFLEDIPQEDVVVTHKNWLAKLIKSKYTLGD